MPEVKDLQQTLRKLISSGKTEQAIQQMTGLGEQEAFVHIRDLVALQSAAFHNFKTNQIKGLLTYDEEKRDLGKINSALLDIIGQLGEPPAPAPAMPSGSGQATTAQTLDGTGNIGLSNIQDSQITIHIGGPQAQQQPGGTATENAPRQKTGFWEWIGRTNNLVGVAAGAIALAGVLGLSPLFGPDQPLSLTVLLDQETTNPYLPFEGGKVTLIYGDKTEGKLIQEEAVFKGIPANFRKEPVIVRFEAQGYMPMDTTFALTGNRIILPIKRDDSLGRIYGTVKDGQGGPVEGVKISVQDLAAYTGSSGEFELSIPLDRQRKSQRIQAQKAGYRIWDYESPIIRHEEISIVLVRQ